MPGDIWILGGPTATGKTALAVELARAAGPPAGIVSADAMTVYRGLDIGTAKPDPAERQGVAHLCIDVRDPDQHFTVADFLEAVEHAQRRFGQVIVAGGTPFYLAALVRPLAELPPGDPTIRAELEALPDPHARLALVDAEAAARLHPNDRVRVLRALEVYRITGRTQSELHARGPRQAPEPLRVAWVDRDDLRARIDLRLQAMRARGYVEEVRALLDAGWSPGLKPLRSFAYCHMVAHVQGALDLDEALRRTGRDTWRFARKQRSWARAMGWTPMTVSEARALLLEKDHP